jgi:hypothetical protein
MGMKPDTARVGIGVFASRPTFSSANDTGHVYLATDQGRVYFCTDGALNTWVEITAFGAAVAMAGLLTLSAGLTLSGGNLDMSSAGRRLIVPAEAWLREGATDIRPHAHAARHLVLGGDPLARLLQDYERAYAAAPAFAVGQAVISKSYDLSGRSGVSRFLVFGSGQVGQDGNGTNRFAGITAELRYINNGVPTTLPNTSHSAGIYNLLGATTGRTVWSSWAIVETVAAAVAQQFSVEITAIQGTTGMSLAHFELLTLDLGAV